VNEAEVPVRFLRYGLLPDSGGAGRWRGGLATVLEFQVFAPDTHITVRNRDRCRFRPWGTLGGKAAEPSDFILNPGTKREKILGNADILTAEPGDVIHIHSPGGGGRGSPLDREPARVLLDVEQGYVSVEAAAALYGVVISADRVDDKATLARRQALRIEAGTSHFEFGPERRAFEDIWDRNAYDGLADILARLPIHWRYFVKTKLFEAMRKLAQEGAPSLAAALENVRSAYPQIPPIA
jgi:N-methylhydantoinase B